MSNIWKINLFYNLIPGCLSVSAHWFPPNERNFATSVTFLVCSSLSYILLRWDRCSTPWAWASPSSFLSSFSLKRQSQERAQTALTPPSLSQIFPRSVLLPSSPPDLCLPPLRTFDLLLPPNICHYPLLTSVFLPSGPLTSFSLLTSVIIPS